MDAAGSEAVTGSAGGVVCRHLDALPGWSRRLWLGGTAAACAVGVAVAVSGSPLAGAAWVLLAVLVGVTRWTIASQRTEVGPSWVSLSGRFARRSIESHEVRLVDLVCSELAGARLVVRGRGRLGIALPVSATERDAELAASLRRFVGSLPPGTPVTAGALEVLAPA